MSNLSRRIEAIEKNTGSCDNLVQQAINTWASIGIDLSIESAEMIAANFRKAGAKRIQWQDFCNVSIEMMREL